MAEPVYNIDEGLQDARWVEIQKKTFTRWVNTYLKERMLKIDSLETDFADGVTLINLLEIISSKAVGKYNKAPKIRSQKLENNLFALNFLKSEGIKLVNIGNEDIVDGKLKLILGLIWTIICRYQIHIEEGKSARSDLLKWVRSKIPEYNIMNFSSDWNDGRAICGLVDALLPGGCPNHRDMNPGNALYNATTGTDVAENKMGIPKILAPEDMVSPDVDELSVMTYISYFRDWEKNNVKKKSQEELERIAVPERCRAYGPGLERGETYIQTEFTIEAINANMRRVNHGGDPFEVVIKSPKAVVVPHRMQDNNDGTYLVQYTPTDIGKHYIGITLHNKHIANSPYQVPVTRSGVDASKCRAYGPGLEGGTAGDKTHFFIEACNRLGERLKEGGDKFDVRIKGPYDVDVLPETTDNRDGTYTVNYRPLDAGEHVVTIAHNGQEIPQSPIRVMIGKPNGVNDADAMQCRAHGPGLERGSTSEVATFTVEARNSRGDLITAGGVPIDVDISDSTGTEVVPRIVDNRNGTFTVTYQPVESGVHTVDVILRHKVYQLYYEHIYQSPFKVPVEAGTDASKSIAFGPGLENNVTDQLPTHFTIQSKDRNGNNLNKGGDPWDVKIQGPNGPVPASVKDNGDGTYTVDYQPTDSGKHKLDVTLKGAPVMKSPFTVFVKEGADDQTSIIEGYSFVIQAKTKKGVAKREGGDNFKVSISGGPTGSVPVDLKDIGNGTYLASYKLNAPGQYVISVTLNGKPLKGYENGIHVSY